MMTWVGVVGLGVSRGLLALVCVTLVAVSEAVEGDGLPPELDDAVRVHTGLQRLLEDYTFRRTVRTTGPVLDRALHEFLLSRPDLGAALARLQGHGPYRVTRVAPGAFEGTDGDGAFASLRVLREAEGLRVFHARGRYVVPLAPDVSGEAVVLLRTAYSDTPQGDLAHGELTVYARLDNRVLGWVLKVLIPFVGDVLDRKMARAFASESRAVEALSRDPEGVLARLAQEPSVAPEDVVRLRELVRSALARRPARPGLPAPESPAESAIGR